MFLVFSFSIVLSMEAQGVEEAAPMEYQESAPVIAPMEYQESAPVIEPVNVSNESTAEAAEAPLEALPGEFQNKAPIVPGFGIWPSLATGLLAGFIILTKRCSAR